MASQSRRLELLTGAMELEARSFLEYVARSAPPFDIERFPELRAGIHRLIADEDAIVADLAVAIEEEGAHPDIVQAFDTRHTFYNFLSTAYALKVIRTELYHDIARFDGLIASCPEAEVPPLLKNVRERKAAQLALAEDLVRRAEADTKVGPAAGTAPAPEAGALAAKPK